MYRLTPRMLQSFRQYLEQYHSLFSAKRCSGWELEELIFRAIQSDNQAQHHAFWKEAGHDDEADIRVRINGDVHFLQIKSGEIKRGHLVLSGHRLGRFKGDLGAISRYLNDNSAEIIAVPYRRMEDDSGRKHIYRVVYVNPEHFTGVEPDRWEHVGAQWRQTSEAGVVFSLRPSMSWQIWWEIPEALLEQQPEFAIG